MGVAGNEPPPEKDHELPGIVSEAPHERKPSPLAPRAAWRAFGAEQTGLEDVPAVELLGRWRASNLHTGSRPWTPTDRALAAEVDARSFGVAQLSRLKDVRCPRWVEELCVKQTAPSARYPNGRRMHRAIWCLILARFITAFREGAIFTKLDYYEGSADINASEKTWERAILEMRAAGLIRWERAYVEITDGTRWRDPDTNLYQLGDVLLEHREALLEGTQHPGPAKRRQWEARTLRAAARRARRTREVEARAAAEARRVRWAEGKPGSRPRRTAPAPVEPPIAETPPAAPPRDQTVAPSEAKDETAERHQGLQEADTARAGREWRPTIVPPADPRPPRAPPLPVKLASLPAPGPGAVPSARPTAPGANSGTNRERMSSDTPRILRAAPDPETNPPLPASPAAGSRGGPAANNAGSSSRPNTASDPGLEDERQARRVEAGGERRRGVPDRKDMSPAIAVEPVPADSFSRSPEVVAALAAVQAMFRERKGSVCSTCSGLKSVITGFMHDSVQRCPDC